MGSALSVSLSMSNRVYHRLPHRLLIASLFSPFYLPQQGKNSLLTLQVCPPFLLSHPSRSILPASASPFTALTASAHISNLAWSPVPHSLGFWNITSSCLLWRFCPESFFPMISSPDPSFASAEQSTVSLNAGFKKVLPIHTCSLSWVHYHNCTSHNGWEDPFNRGLSLS